MKNTTLLKGNEREIADKVVPYMVSALSDSLLGLFSINEYELCTAMLSIALSEGSKQSKKGAVVFQSVLVIRGNNAFGIKGKGIPIGTYEYLNGNKEWIKSSFASFNCFESSLKYILNFIGTNKIYSKARKATTGEAFLRELHKAGYATSPDWFDKFTIPTFQKIYNNDKGIDKEGYWTRFNDIRTKSYYWTIDVRSGSNSICY